MARVPTYDGPQVQTRALNPVYQRPIDVSSGLQSVARGLGQVGEAADRIALREAETEANRIDSEITTGWLEWDAANRQKYRGQNVGEYETAARQWWDEAKQKHGQSVNPLVQRQIGMALGRKQTQAMASVIGFVGQEKERFADESAEAAAQTSIEFGIDTGDTGGAAARVRQIAAEKGARKGWTTEMVQGEQQRLLGTLHLSYITRMAESDPTKAQAYYEANKAEIPGTAQARVEQVLKAEVDNQFAAQFAAERAGKPLSEQLADAAKITDPERREKSLQQVRNNYALVQQAQREREQAASDSAWQLVGQGKRVPERVLLQMNGKERVQLQDHLRERAKQATTGTAVKTDPTALATIYDMARDDPDGFKSIKLQSLTTKIAGSDLEQIARLQRDMGKPDKEKDVLTAAQQIGSAMKGLRKRDQAAFQAAAYDAMLKFDAEKGRAPNSQERKVIIDDLLVSGVLEDSFLWFDTEKPKFTMTPEERDSATFPQPTTAADKFNAGQVYRDANGNRAKYIGNGKWEPVK